ncbi:hypothetical protein AVEN_145161-1 [Araneus ventricosus]|uniref:Uncharacterized protein n=1 Tax=Araneus ventricosus TaxID=182803 RepID=A0A4Y2R7B1_ARAVE|nr:hypothetical protein AVEN_145161-1 [Araneus ventricosus]
MPPLDDETAIIRRVSLFDDETAMRNALDKKICRVHPCLVSMTRPLNQARRIKPAEFNLTFRFDDEPPSGLSHKKTRHSTGWTEETTIRPNAGSTARSVETTIRPIAGSIHVPALDETTIRSQVQFMSPFLETRLPSGCRIKFADHHVFVSDDETAIRLT